MRRCPECGKRLWFWQATLDEITHFDCWYQAMERSVWDALIRAAFVIAPEIAKIIIDAHRARNPVDPMAAPARKPLPPAS
jgi:hypothetical protein